MRAASAMSRFVFVVNNSLEEIAYTHPMKVQFPIAVRQVIPKMCIDLLHQLFENRSTTSCWKASECEMSFRSKYTKNGAIHFYFSRLHS